MFFRSKSKISEPKKHVVASVDDISKTLLAGGTFLPYGDYHSMWIKLAAERDVCSRYVARIINLLMNFEADPIKMEKQLQKTSAVNIDYFLTSLLNTLHFLDMFVGIDPTNGAFVASIEKYEHKKRSTPRFKLKRVDDALNELSRRRMHRGHIAVKLVVDSTSLDSDAEMQRAMQKSASELMFLDESGLDNIIDSTRADYPYTFTCLTRIARAGNASQVLDELLRQLNGGTGCTISALPHMQGRTFAILLMLRELLVQNPTNDDAWMQRTSGVVSSFYKWPKPYGPFARDMIEFIDTERRSPGWHLRQRLLSELPSLRLSPSEAPGFIGTASGTGHTFVFLDGSAPESRAFADLFDMGSLSHDTADTSDSSVEALEMKKKILTHIIDLDFCIRESSDNGNPDPLGLNDKDNLRVENWYARAMMICARAKDLPCDCDPNSSSKAGDPDHLPPGGLAKLFREANLSEIIDEISSELSYCARRAPLFDKSAIPAASVRMSTTNLPGAPTSAPFPPSAPQAAKILAALLENGDDEEEADRKEADGGSADQNATAEEDDGHEMHIPEPVLSFGEYSPAAPPVKFSTFEFSPDVIQAPATSKRISVPLDCKKLKYLNDHIDVSALRQLVGASREATAGQLIVGPTIVKVMLIGGNFVVSKFLCALVSLASKDKAVLDNIEFEFYVVPCSRNDISTFLARSDKWYRRHIYYPFVGPVGLCPQLDLSQEAENIKASFADSLCIPVKCQQSLLEDFSRHANQTVKTCIFECLCWTEYEENRNSRTDGATEGPSVCIPFVTGLELGVFVQASIYKKQLAGAVEEGNNSGAAREPCFEIPSYGEDKEELKNVFLSKHFAPTSIELSISYAASTMAGDVAEESVIRSGQYMTVSFNNFPDMYDDFGQLLRKNKSEYEVPASPEIGSLVMNSRSTRNGLKDLLANRKKNMKGKSDWFMDALIEADSFDIPVNVSIVDIVAVNPLETFNVSIDGRIFGPFKRIVVQPCQVLNAEGIESPSVLPIKSFLPIAP